MMAQRVEHRSAGIDRQPALAAVDGEPQIRWLTVSVTAKGRGCTTRIRL